MLKYLFKKQQVWKHMDIFVKVYRFATLSISVIIMKSDRTILKNGQNYPKGT